MNRIIKNKVLALTLLVFAQAVIVGCQSSSQPVSTISDIPPFGAKKSENLVLVSMGGVSLLNKQVLAHIQTLDPNLVTEVLKKDGRLEDLVRGVALRANVIARAAAQNWLERPEIKSKIDEARRFALYSLYVSEKSEPAADYPDIGSVMKAYENNKKQQAAAGKPPVKPLFEMAASLRQQLREQQKQLNEKKYIDGLLSSNPVKFDLQKLVDYINLPPQQRQQRQQQQQRMDEPVVSMGSTNVGLGLVLKSLGSLAPAQQQQLFGDTGQLQQYLTRLALQYHVLDKALIEEFDTRPAVKNQVEEARRQVIYTSYMQALTAPQSGFPGAALLEQHYRNNLQALTTPERYRLAEIVIANSGDDEADRTRALQFANAVRTGSADFAAVARQYSEKPQSANNGGDIGWVNPQGIAPGLRPAIVGKAPGTIVGPVKYDWGWQIIRILDRQPGRRQTLQEARPALVADLRRQRRAEKEKQIVEQLTNREPINIDKGALEELRKQIAG